MSWLTAAIKAGTGLSKMPEGVFRAATQGAKEASPVSRHLLDVKAFSEPAKRTASKSASRSESETLGEVREKVAKQIDSHASAKQLSESADASWKLGAPLYETERVYLHAFKAAGTKDEAYQVLDSALNHPGLTDAIKKGLERSGALPGKVPDRLVSDLLKEAETVWNSGSSRYETEKLFAAALEAASTKTAAFSVAESAAHLPAFDKIVEQALEKGHGLSN